MIDDQLVLRVERLRDAAENLRDELQGRYKRTGTVTAKDIRGRAVEIAERWLVEIAPRKDVADVVGAVTIADRSVEFQRLLTHAERSTQRKKYDGSLRAILGDFSGDIVVPLKAARIHSPIPNAPQQLPPSPIAELAGARVAFVGKSFAPDDSEVNDAVERLLTALGLDVLTGERPRASSVSQKVQKRIDRAEVFVGVFTRREKLEGRDEYATSAWIVDEKAYALAKQKKLVLLRERGINSIGGLQGDYEYVEFDRSDLVPLMISIVDVFHGRG